MRPPPPAIAAVLLLCTLVPPLASAGCTRRPGLCEDGSRTAPLCKRVERLELELGKRDEAVAAMSMRSDAQRDDLVQLRGRLSRVEARLDLIAPIGVPACDRYVARYMRCIDEIMPDAARDTAHAALRRSVDTWHEAATTRDGREGLAVACGIAWDAVKDVCSGD